MMRAGVLAFVALAAHESVVAQPCVHEWSFPTEEYIGAAAVHDDGSGEALYTAGQCAPWPNQAWCVRRWAGLSSTVIGVAPHPALPSPVLYALASFDDGGGSRLYAAGYYALIEGIEAKSLARWDGVAWSRLPGGDLGYKAYPAPIIRVLYPWDDGSGPALYVGGFITSAAGVPVNGIARWDGESWSSLGAGVSDGVVSMAAYDDGTGESLYVGGFFDFAGPGIYSRGIARWDGGAWHSVAGGTISQGEGFLVDAISVFDAGSGPALYAAGCFKAVGYPNTVPNTARIARWDASGWSSIGSANSQTQCISGLAVFDDGVRGPALYAAGGPNFTSIGGASVQGIARYDGRGWTSIDAPPAPYKTGVFPFPVAGVPTLWVGGQFVPPSGMLVALGLYQYTCDPCYPDCDASGTLTIADFACFQGKFAAGAPEADCNENGALTIADFGCFQAKFVQGCP